MKFLVASSYVVISHNITIKKFMDQVLDCLTTDYPTDLKQSNIFVWKWCLVSLGLCIYFMTIATNVKDQTNVLWLVGMHD